MQLPISSYGEIQKLNSIFDTVTMSYKYYWFLAILEEIEQRKKDGTDLLLPMEANRLALRILTLVWYSTHYFMLNFGIGEKLSTAAFELKTCYNLSINEKNDTLLKVFEEKLKSKDAVLTATVQQLLKYVPVKLLKNWTPKGIQSQSGYSKKEIDEFYSEPSKNMGPYTLSLSNSRPARLMVQLNPKFADYFVNNLLILKDFCYYNLVLFLEKRNPGVPNIAQKIINKLDRDSLAKQKELFDQYFKHHKNSMTSIYNNSLIDMNDYAIDHFIPWTFMYSDLIYNLVPIDKTTNSQKSNNLPNCKYIEKLALFHYELVQGINSGIYKAKDKIVTDYLSLGAENIKALATNNPTKFTDLFLQRLSPLLQIAKSNGFNE